MMITDIFFDLDRTLWDFETNSDLALRELFTQFRLEEKIANQNQFIEDYNRINEELWERYRKGLTTKEELRIKRFDEALKLHGIDDVEFARQYCEHYIDLCPRQTATFPNTHEVLAELKDSGKRLHIITNGFSEVQHRKMTHCGIIDFFDVVICSDQVGYNKPDVKIFQIALEQAKVKAPHTLMIGDHPEIDVLGANQVGMRGVLFDPLNHYQPHPSIERITHLSQLPNLIIGI